jgi:hypothetical protein
LSKNKPITKILLNLEETEYFHDKFKKNKKRLLLSLLFNTLLDAVDKANGQENEIKDVQIFKEEIKLLLLLDGIILNIENPKEFFKNYDN